MTTEQTRRQAITNMVDSWLDTDGFKQILAILGQVQNTEKLEKALLISREFRNQMVAIWLESDMEAETADGIREAMPHLLKLMAVMYQPGFQVRWADHLSKVQARLDNE